MAVAGTDFAQMLPHFEAIAIGQAHIQHRGGEACCCQWLRALPRTLAACVTAKPSPSRRSKRACRRHWRRPRPAAAGWHLMRG